MIRGWCPTIHAPMPSGDGLLVRVKPFGGRLPSAALASLAEAAAAYANGTIELTGRGNLQIRGVHNPAAFAHAMLTAGLADPDPDREARRNVTALPGCDDALVAEAEDVLAETPGLPAKFGVIVEGRVIHVGNAAASTTYELRQLLTRASPLTQPSPPGRGLPSPPPLVGGGDAAKGSAGFFSPWNGSGGRGEGCDAHPLGHGTHVLYPELGQTTAPTLAHLATLTPEIRTTPWRAFLSPVLAPGFATQPGTITACPGAPACASGQTAARADAARLQAAGFTHLHVSGCAKGCAHPAATTTLTGRNGRYDLIRHGRASDPPDHQALTLTEAMALL